MHHTASSSSLSISHLRHTVATPAAGSLLLDSLPAPSASGFESLLTRPTRPSPAISTTSGFDYSPSTTSKSGADEPDSTATRTEKSEEQREEPIDEDASQAEPILLILSQASQPDTPQTAIAREATTEQSVELNRALQDAVPVVPGDDSAVPQQSATEAEPHDSQSVASAKSASDKAADSASQQPSAVQPSAVQPTGTHAEETGSSGKADSKSGGRNNRSARTAASGRNAPVPSGSADAVRGDPLLRGGAVDTISAARIDPSLSIDPAHQPAGSEAPIDETDVISSDIQTVSSLPDNLSVTGGSPANGASPSAHSTADGLTSSAATLGSGSASSSSNLSRSAATGAAADTPGAAGAGQQSRLVDRVMRGIEQLQDGATQVRVRLHPPQLGSLQMSLRIEQSQMQLELVVESAAARDAVRTRMQELEGRLAEQGLELQRVEIKVAGQSTAGSGQDMPGGSPQHDWNRPEQPPQRQPSSAQQRSDNRPSDELTPVSRQNTNQPATSIDIRA